MSFRTRLFANYERLDEDLRAVSPVQRVWTVTTEEHGEDGGRGAA